MNDITWWWLKPVFPEQGDLLELLLNPMFHKAVTLVPQTEEQQLSLTEHLQARFCAKHFQEYLEASLLAFLSLFPHL